MNLKIDKIIKNKRRKNISLQVNEKGELIAKVPVNVCVSDLNKFVLKNTDWIIKQKQKAVKKQQKLSRLNYDPNDRRKYKKAIRKYFRQRVDHYCSVLNVEYKKIKLSGAKKRWGSCSSKSNINLNWRLIFAPKEVIDYVVLHEVVHLKHLNHSKKFWLEIEQIMPDYKDKITWLKQNDYILQID